MPNKILANEWLELANRYPGGGNNFLPSDKEIEKVIEVADHIYKTVNKYINKQ